MSVQVALVNPHDEGCFLFFIELEAICLDSKKKFLFHHIVY